MDITTNNIHEIIRNSKRVNQIIETIGTFNGEHLFLTGGSIRNVVWNSLHYYSENYELEDCDIIFHNQFNISKRYEKFIAQELNYICPHIKWSVKNQARMHTKNKHMPYRNISNALYAFPETCSAIAIDKDWNIIAPYGVNDLIGLLIKPTKFCEANEIDVFYDRALKKNWKKKWTNLVYKENNSSLLLIT